MSKLHTEIYMLFGKGSCWFPLAPRVFLPPQKHFPVSNLIRNCGQIVTNNCHFQITLGLKSLSKSSFIIREPCFQRVGGAVASWLVNSTPDRAGRVRALAGDIALCSWARHFILIVPLSTHMSKWVPAN